MIRRHLLVTLGLAGALALSGCATMPAGTTDTQTFVQRASVSNLFEIQTSQVALQRSQNAEVRAFAEQMIADHTKATSDMQAAVSNDPAAGQPAMQLDPPHQAMLTRLQTASDANFDKVYIDEQKAAHAEALTLFRTYSEGGQPGPVRDFATATLPTLQMHAEHVQRLSDQR